MTKKEKQTTSLASQVTIVDGKESSPGQRKRLAKFFSRPLDKEIRNLQEPVRCRFVLLKSERNQLLRLKSELSDQGVEVRKSDLVRVGLALLFKCTTDDVGTLWSEIAKQP